MDEAAFEQVAATFAAFHARFAPLFGRTEAREHSEQYVRGLVVQQAERRNAENLAEAVEGVTAEVTDESKADLALALRRQARAAGHLTGRWVTGDEDYGKVPGLRDALDADGDWYVLEVPRTTPVFAHPVTTAVPAWSGRGR